MVFLPAAFGWNFIVRVMLKKTCWFWSCGADIGCLDYVEAAMRHNYHVSIIQSKLCQLEIGVVEHYFAKSFC